SRLSTVGRGAPDAAILSASRSSSPARRATSTSSWPCRAKISASAQPIPAEAPVISVTGRPLILPVSLGSLPAAARRRDAPPQRDAIARRDREQVGDAPHHVLLELAHVAVGVAHLPQHLDEPQPARLVERSHQQAGEMIEVD